VDDFVEKLDRTEPPGQLVAVLTDPLLQKNNSRNTDKVLGTLNTYLRSSMGY
jgi:hypothetical protein